MNAIQRWLVVVCVFLSISVHAVAFTVDSLGDAPDADPGDTYCDDGTGHCTLRAAIMEGIANGYIGTIAFSVAGTITPATPLPTITLPVTIDGSYAPGASVNTLTDANNAKLTVELDGSAVAAGNGLHFLNTHGCIVRGLVINRFGLNGIRVESSLQVQVVGCFIGTDASGKVALPNGDDGVNVLSSKDVFIGGAPPSDHNIIAGNAFDGIEFFASTNSWVHSNFIGVDSTGLAPLGNGLNGVLLVGGSTGITVGGPSDAYRNVISANDVGIGIKDAATHGNFIRHNLIGVNATGNSAVGNTGPGIRINDAHGNEVEANVLSGNGTQGVRILNPGASNNVVTANFIGTDGTGTNAFPNGEMGVYISGAAKNNVIGGDPSFVYGNVIAFNATNGVMIAADATGNLIQGNSIFSNTPLGIDLLEAPATSGVTTNDVGDADAGGNGLQNYPVLTVASNDASNVIIGGFLASAPNTTYRLEFFANRTRNPGGFGQGETWIGDADVTTDAGGTNIFSFSFPGTQPTGTVFAATATDPNNNTSEFSAFFPNCVLNVTRLSQGDPLWDTNTYDHSAHTIRARGCALTCLTMSLRFAGTTNIALSGGSVTNDPGNLNTFMIAHVGDFSGSAVNWANATRDASAGTLVWHADVINSVTHFADATNYLHQTVCGLGRPVSVKVNLTSSPSHFVLVTGWDGENFTIADPGHADRTSLTNYNNHFETRGYVEPVPPAPAPAPSPVPGVLAVAAAAADVSALYVSSSDNVRLLITDPAGNRVGIDADGTPFTEIADAVHFIDEIGDDETDAPAEQSAHQVYIDHPLTGDYHIAVSGFRTGAYEVITRAFAPDGSAQSPVTFDGMATNGPLDEFTVPLDFVPPAVHDLAVTKLKAPKKVTLQEGKTPKPGKLIVSIANLGPSTEVISDATVLSQLVQINVTSLGECPAPAPTLVAPTVFPIILAPKKKLNLSYSVNVNCANDDLAGAGHEDYQWSVVLDHSALDGNADTAPANDLCPRPPDPATGDKGCAKGVEVLTDASLKP